MRHATCMTIPSPAVARAAREREGLARTTPSSPACPATRQAPGGLAGMPDERVDDRELSARVSPSVRATGILVEGGAILLEHMVLRERSHWTLPGGKLEYGETLQQCLVREMREETGLRVEVGDLLYVCDRFHGLGSHVVDMSFLVRRAPGSRVACPLPATDDGVAEVAMVPFDRLEDYGFSPRFARLVEQGFPGRGSYRGEFHAFYG